MKRNILIIMLLIIIDQSIKAIVINNINYVENSGAAFGLLPIRLFLIVMEIIMIVCIIKLLLSKKYELGDNTKLGLSVIIAGGIGNLIDRVFRGYVIDYIDISKIIAFPVFNFADMCIIVGVIIVFITILIGTVKAQEAAQEQRQQQQGRE